MRIGATLELKDDAPEQCRCEAKIFNHCEFSDLCYYCMPVASQFSG